MLMSITDSKQNLGVNFLESPYTEVVNAFLAIRDYTIE